MGSQRLADLGLLGLCPLLLWMQTFDPWATPGVLGLVLGFNLFGQVLLSLQGVWGGRLVDRFHAGVGGPSGAASEADSGPQK